MEMRTDRGTASHCGYLEIQGRFHHHRDGKHGVSPGSGGRCGAKTACKPGDGLPVRAVCADSSGWGRGREAEQQAALRKVDANEKQKICIQEVPGASPVFESEAL